MNMAAAVGVKIHLFKFTQKAYQDIGIIPFQTNQKRSFVNSKNLFFLYLFAVSIASSAAYLLFEACSIIEYGMVFFTCTTVVLIFIEYLIILWQMENILSYIENCERFIEKSGYQDIIVALKKEFRMDRMKYNFTILIYFVVSIDFVCRRTGFNDPL